MTGILKFCPKMTRPSKPINLVSLTFSYNFCVFMLAFVIYNFAYQMMYKSRRKKRGMIIFGQMFVIPAIVYSDDSYENLRIFFLSFASFFFSSFFILVCSLIMSSKRCSQWSQKFTVVDLNSEWSSHPEAYYNPKDQSRQILEFTSLIKFYV